MDTKLVDKIYLDKNNILGKIQSFVNSSYYIEAFNEFEKLLKNRWIKIDKFNLCYDNKIKALWIGICEDTKYVQYSNGIQIDDIIDKVKINNKTISHFKLTSTINSAFKIEKKITFPTKEELVKSFTNIEKAPFAIKSGRPHFTCYYIYNKNGYTQGFDCDKSYLINSRNSGYAVPLIRLFNENTFKKNNIEVFLKFLLFNLTPKKLIDNKDYLKAKNELKEIIIKNNQIWGNSNLNISFEEFLYMFKQVKLDSSNLEIIPFLLNEDKERADLLPYDEKILEDIEQGHWSLWNKESKLDNEVEIILDKQLVARDPKSSIVNGVVGIDFGTKSTVVAYQKDNTKILPMRVGTGELNKEIESIHYENPTVMQFKNIKNFFEAYKKRDGKPYTKWDDITISLAAFNNMINSKSDNFNTFLDELKQWAGDKSKKLKLIDTNKYILDLEPFLEIDDSEFNPIEVYAYYLGLHINNMRNGIFMNYILSFPVTYEVEIREKILESFKKGIKKSLPQELHNQKGEVDKLSVKQGASEPAAYAIVALQEYKFDPEGDEKVFYGVFDFGGGTTDFDYGIFREASRDKKERRYDYVIEHFGAGGDRYLGGENLLDLLAFEVFKDNKDKLLEKSIQFMLPPECSEFLGSETLLSNSREAKLNHKLLAEKLRAFWEDVEDKKDEYEKGFLELNLVGINGRQSTNIELDFNKEKALEILRKRIEKGVDNFFHSLRLAFEHKDIDLHSIKEINIFLAGNSSKSKIVKELFKTKMAEIQTDMVNGEDVQEVFKLIEPLANSIDTMEKPTGKTGVAYGLIEAREGGDILVIDHNIDNKDEKEIKFKYYLGESRKKRFNVIIDRDLEYNKWVEFIDASIDSFEIYYSSSSIVTSNKISIDDESIKRIMLKIEKTDDEAMVYTRLIDPTTFEYVVAKENELEQENYLTDIVQIEI